MRSSPITENVVRDLAHCVSRLHKRRIWRAKSRGKSHIGGHFDQTLTFHLLPPVSNSYSSTIIARSLLVGRKRRNSQQESQGRRSTETI